MFRSQYQLKTAEKSVTLPPSPLSEKKSYTNKQHFALFFWITARVITTPPHPGEKRLMRSVKWESPTLLPISRVYVLFRRCLSCLRISANVQFSVFVHRSAVLPTYFAQQFQFFFTDLLIKRLMCHFWGCNKLFAHGWSLWHNCREKKSVAYYYVLLTFRNIQLLWHQARWRSYCFARY